MLYRIFLSPTNEQLLVNAVKNRSGVRLTFDSEDFDETPADHHILDLSKDQVDGLERAAKTGHPYILKLTAGDVERNISSGGGLFDILKGLAGPLISKIGPTLTKLLPGLGMAAATGIINAGASHATKKALEDEKRGRGLTEDVSDIGSILQSKQKSSQTRKGNYSAYGLNLSEDQVRKIAKAYQENEDVSIRLHNSQLQGGHKMFLTNSQISRIEKCLHQGTGLVLNLSKTQVKAQGIQGGFLGELLGGLAGHLLTGLFSGNNGKGFETGGSKKKNL